MKSLTLADYSSNVILKQLKSALFPNIEYFCLDLYSPFLLDLSEFIKINGETLKSLVIHGIPIDEEYLGKLNQSIG